MFAISRLGRRAGRPGAGRSFKPILTLMGVVIQVVTLATVLNAQKTTTGPVDPGVRGGPPGAGGFFKGLTPDQVATETGLHFSETNLVAGGTSFKEVGLGATFNSNSCDSCHAQPATGGSS